MGDTVVPHPPARRQSESILQRRIRKFRRLKRGYYSFVAVVAAYALSFFLPVLANNIALVVKYNGTYYFTSVHYRSAGEFGHSAFGDPEYRALRQQLAEAHQGNWV
jgi:microcin C transport system permease protein